MMRWRSPWYALRNWRALAVVEVLNTSAPCSCSRFSIKSLTEVSERTRKTMQAFFDGDIDWDTGPPEKNEPGVQQWRRRGTKQASSVCYQREAARGRLLFAHRREETKSSLPREASLW